MSKPAAQFKFIHSQWQRRRSKATQARREGGAQEGALRDSAIGLLYAACETAYQQMSHIAG
jgi:hypothetical protein